MLQLVASLAAAQLAGIVRKHSPLIFGQERRGIKVWLLGLNNLEVVVRGPTRHLDYIITSLKRPKQAAVTAVVTAKISCLPLKYLQTVGSPSPVAARHLVSEPAPGRHSRHPDRAP